MLRCRARANGLRWGIAWGAITIVCAFASERAQAAGVGGDPLVVPSPEPGPLQAADEIELEAQAALAPPPAVRLCDPRNASVLSQLANRVTCPQPDSEPATEPALPAPRTFAAAGSPAFEFDTGTLAPAGVRTPPGSASARGAALLALLGLGAAGAAGGDASEPERGFAITLPATDAGGQPLREALADADAAASRDDRWAVQATMSREELAQRLADADDAGRSQLTERIAALGRSMLDEAEAASRASERTLLDASTDWLLGDRSPESDNGLHSAGEAYLSARETARAVDERVDGWRQAANLGRRDIGGWNAPFARLRGQIEVAVHAMLDPPRDEPGGFLSNVSDESARIWNELRRRRQGRVVGARVKDVREVSELLGELYRRQRH